MPVAPAFVVRSGPQAAQHETHERMTALIVKVLNGPSPPAPSHDSVQYVFWDRPVDCITLSFRGLSPDNAISACAKPTRSSGPGDPVP